jgi:glutamyl-tRNA synthetase
MRMEDLDGPRVVAGAEKRIEDDLRWLGLTWDEGPDAGGAFGPYRQSERTARYEASIAKLEERGSIYLCDCSRAEIARVASAPHEGEEVRYPGTCRAFGMKERAWKRPPAVRFAVPEDARVRFEDVARGPIEQDVAEVVGDFVLRRGDGVFAYQLAVVVDDLAMEIERVVRGADLLSSTARQLLLARALGGTPPSYLHAPLVVDALGERLAKRARGVPIRDHRDVGRAPDALLGALAHALGLADDPRPTTPHALLPSYDVTRLSRGPVRLPSSLLTTL